MSDPLYGHNLVRLLYLDEAGTSSNASFLAVSGVIVHGDVEWPQVDARILALIDKYIPEQDRAGFVFHATDVFHGARYFDRRKPEWDSEKKRWPILLDLAQVIADLHLPVVAGFFRKDKFGVALLARYQTHAERAKQVQNLSVLDCLIWADRWLARYAPNELATVVHEDGTQAKPLIKRTVRMMRSKDLIAKYGVPDATRIEFDLPLKRIIDTVHFAEKPDARPLQLADLCAFILGRTMQEKSVPQGVFDIIWKQLSWVTGDGIKHSRLSSAGNAEQSA